MDKKYLFLKLSDIDKECIDHDILEYYFNPPIEAWENVIRDFYKRGGEILTNAELEKIIKNKVEYRLQHESGLGTKFFIQAYVKRNKWVPYMMYGALLGSLLFFAVQVGLYCKRQYQENYFKTQTKNLSKQIDEASYFVSSWQQTKNSFVNYDGILKVYLNKEAVSIDEKSKIIEGELEKDKEILQENPTLEDLKSFQSLKDASSIGKAIDEDEKLIDIEKNGTDLIKNNKLQSIDLDSAIESLRGSLEIGDLTNAKINYGKLEQIVKGSQKVFLWSDASKSWYNKVMFSGPDLASKKIINDLYDKINLSSQQEIIDNDLSDLLIQYANLMDQKVVFKIMDAQEIPVGFVRNDNYYMVLQAFDEQNNPIAVPVNVESGIKSLNIFGLAISQDEYEKLKVDYKNKSLKNKVYGYKNKKSLIYNFNINNENLYTEYIPGKS